MSIIINGCRLAQVAAAGLRLGLLANASFHQLLPVLASVAAIINVAN